MCKSCLKPWATEFDGTPCAVKAARTVWIGGKGRDDIKALPIDIRREVPGHEALNVQLNGSIEEAETITYGKERPVQTDCNMSIIYKRNLTVIVAHVKII